MPNDKQNRQKLNLLVDQVYKHAKKHSLEAFMMYSGEDAEKLKMSGNYSENMVRNVVAHMLINHPEIFADVIDAVNKFTSQDEPKEEEVKEEPKLVVEP